ncbi:MAG TPA: S9 family peptidase [Candidatus Tectomicrobia bacterium]|nr:S9 family peptidase [Candidatus Tectomicrobia bacterium]
MKHFLVTFLLPMTLAAQNLQQLTEQLGKTVLYGDLAPSPDGAHLSWVQSTAATTSKQTYVREISGNTPAKPLKLSLTDDRTDYDPAWSPDSKTLAFFASAGKKNRRQLWTVNANGSGAKKITNLNGYAARPRWSHDGKQIAFLYIEGAGGGGPLVAAPATTGVIDTAIHNQRIAVLDVTNGQLRQVSPPDLHVYDYDWSPDDKMFVVTAASGPGDNNWWIAQIYTIDTAKGDTRSIYKPSFQVAVPRWSPDGKSIAFIEGLMSDEGFHGGDLFTMSADGRDVTNRTSSRKASINSFFWQAPSRILLVEYVGSGSAISELNPTDNSTRTIWKGSEGIHAFGNFPNFALSDDGNFAAIVRSTYNSPPEVFAGPIGEWHQLTNNNAELQANWGKAESIEWTNEGSNIQGWLVPAAESEPGKNYPMVVLIHGGPSSVTTSEWPASFGMSRAIIAALSVRGYYVLLPNPRGSYGQGQDFTRANVKDFGGGDLRDDLAGVDAAIKKHPIDANRLGVTGWSYGGFMTMWAVTQTDRFRAAVAGAGIANWQSYYGQNLIGQWMIPFFGASVYDDPDVYEKSSAIRFIKNVKTPTLVIVGERDAECPASQSYEFWHALKTLGVPTKLIVYPSEGHMFIEPKHQVDRLEQTVSWFDKYLK